MNTLRKLAPTFKKLKATTLVFHGQIPLRVGGVAHDPSDIPHHPPENI
jgi:hypothetical protein